MPSAAELPGDGGQPPGLRSPGWKAPGFWALGIRGSPEPVRFGSPVGQGTQVAIVLFEESGMLFLKHSLR